MKCPFKNCGCEDDIKHFDDPIHHLVITMNPIGFIHIHGPFDDEVIMKRFNSAFKNEMIKHGFSLTNELPIKIRKEANEQPEKDNKTEPEEN